MFEKDILPAAEKFNWHWGFQWAVNEQHRSEVLHPPRDTTVITMDYMAIIFFQYMYIYI